MSNDGDAGKEMSDACAWPKTVPSNFPIKSEVMFDYSSFRSFYFLNIFTMLSLSWS